MRTISIGDIHGRDYWKKINFSLYDLVVFLGDYCDQWPPFPDSKILENLLAIIELKKKFGDKIVLLWGNHDLSYLYQGDWMFSCPGFRPALAPVLNLVFRENEHLFKIAHQEGQHLWTHAGMTKDYYEKSYFPVERQFLERFPEMSSLNLAERMNIMMQTSFSSVLTDRGFRRGGAKQYGGILWADRSEHEMCQDGFQGYHQITGHNEIDSPYTIFRGADSSVTFTDCLSNEVNFYEKEI